MHPCEALSPGYPCGVQASAPGHRRPKLTIREIDRINDLCKRMNDFSKRMSDLCKRIEWDVTT